MATAPQLDVSRLSPEKKAELRWRLEKRREYATLNAEENRKLISRLTLEGDLSKFAREAWRILE